MWYDAVVCTTLWSDYVAKWMKHTYVRIKLISLWKEKKKNLVSIQHILDI